METKIQVVLCLSAKDELEQLMSEEAWKEIDTQRLVLVYEPPSAISGGADFHPDSKENIDEQVKTIKEILDRPVLYGGSVTDENVKELISDNVDGVLVGQKSLDPEYFAAIIQNYPR